MSNRYRLLKVMLLALVALQATYAAAGTLRIEGESKLELALEGGKLKVNGSYLISNGGDEVAHNVFPLFEFGDWRWAGDGKSIAPGKSESWTLHEAVDVKRLGCQVAGDTSCNDIQKGYFVIKILRMYEDANGHPFSAPDLLRVFLGDISGEERAALRVPSAKLSFVCNGDGNEFTCNTSLRNESGRALTFNVWLHSTREVTIDESRRAIELAPGAESTQTFEIKNSNGLSGSFYPVFAAAEWDEQGTRNTVVANAGLAIEEPSHTKLYLSLAGGALLVVLGALYFFVLRAR